MDTLDAFIIIFLDCFVFPTQFPRGLNLIKQVSFLVRLISGWETAKRNIEKIGTWNLILKTTKLIRY